MSRPGSRLESRFENRFETRPSSRPSSRASARPALSTAGRIAPASDAELGRPRAQSRHSLPGPSSTSPGSGKRKRDVPGVAADGLLKTPIVVKVCLVLTFVVSGGGDHLHGLPASPL